MSAATAVEAAEAEVAAAIGVMAAATSATTGVVAAATSAAIGIVAEEEAAAADGGDDEGQVEKRLDEVSSSWPARKMIRLVWVIISR